MSRLRRRNVDSSVCPDFASGDEVAARQSAPGRHVSSGDHVPMKWCRLIPSLQIPSASVAGLMPGASAAAKIILSHTQKAAIGRPCRTNAGAHRFELQCHGRRSMRLPFSVTETQAQPFFRCGDDGSVDGIDRARGCCPASGRLAFFRCRRRRAACVFSNSALRISKARPVADPFSLLKKRGCPPRPGPSGSRICSRNILPLHPGGSGYVSADDFDRLVALPRGLQRWALC